MTCAHRSFPLGSLVKVTDIATGKNVSLEVNDRGPYVKGRIVDLSEGAARELGLGSKGLILVRVELISTVHPVEAGLSLRGSFGEFSKHVLNRPHSRGAWRP